MPRMWVALAVVGALWVGAAAPAYGQDSDDKARSQQHYAAGVQAYNVGDFDVAIAEWKKGYRLHNAPDFLFNIAQAYRGKADYQNAIFFINAFLREKPDAPNVDEVIAVRTELEKLLAESQPAQPDNRTTSQPETTPEPTPKPEPAPVIPPTQQPTDRPANVGRSLKIAGLISGGTGLALIATGVAFSLSASSTQSDLEEAARAGEPWTEELEDRESSGERNSTLGAVFVATGAAAVVGGAVAYTLGWRKGRTEQSNVAVTPTRSGASVIVRFDF